MSEPIICDLTTPVTFKISKDKNLEIPDFLEFTQKYREIRDSLVGDPLNMTDEDWQKLYEPKRKAVQDAFIAWIEQTYSVRLGVSSRNGILANMWDIEKKVARSLYAEPEESPKSPSSTDSTQVQQVA
jgi:hypothetical protein